MFTLRISARLWLLMGLSLALFFVAIAAGLSGMKTAAEALRTVYEDRAVAMDQLARVESVLRANRTEALLAFQHAPDHAFARLHDHPVQLHLDAMNRRMQEATDLWQAYMATYLTEEEKVLAADFERKRAAWLVREAPKTDSDTVILGDWNAPPGDACWKPRWRSARPAGLSADAPARMCWSIPICTI